MRIAGPAGSMAAEYRMARRGIDAIDRLIAPTATVVDADLVTTNVHHLALISGRRSLYAT